MPSTFKPMFTGFAIITLIIATAFYKKQEAPGRPGTDPLPVPLESPMHPAKKIQVAILLDVSNSMDGLIDQAKAQLWNMVSVMGKASCDGFTPQIEIALYEYGRSSNNPGAGYVQRINSFTKDLDQVSKNLFRLTTNGGDEYCGQVMFTSLKELEWDATPGQYKVIFIAGNEDFLQGNLPFTKACTAAKQKGVIVNTIYCGDRMQGIREHWNLGAECGSGSFTNINADAKIDDIATPYDDPIFKLNEKLNDTYIGYGVKGEESKAKQAEMDAANYQLNKSSAAKRAAVKSQKSVYRNEAWDLVDAEAEKPGFSAKIPKSSLPKELQNKSDKELELFIRQTAAERETIQKEITLLNNKREAFLRAEKAKKNSPTEQTLETEIEKILKQQAGRYKMVIK
ncbi:vWA domain-containing protein [Flavihumibacter fluvii]|uniref:vWA domain-containing protein n=1 Tax=Flavihumibacter fluvii TaxID=2838157 RepID=UPI001BDEB4AD|nr:vWA domain-containing protein [Flavihumibacter fluvii]ULQ52239.1 VWA domain-containing protein [Flavihumibacter fluvii]